MGVVVGILVFLYGAISVVPVAPAPVLHNALAATAVSTAFGTVQIPTPLVYTPTSTRSPVYATTTATVFVPFPTSTPIIYPQVLLQKRVDNIFRPGAITAIYPAGPSDELTYTLLVTNVSNTPVYGYVFQDDLRDVMDYADIIAADGDNPTILNYLLSWSPVTIPAFGSVTKTFRIRVKNPLPIPLVHDLVMTNVFGNPIQVFLANIPIVITPTFTPTGSPTNTPTTSITRTATPIIPDRDRSHTPTRTRTATPSHTPYRTDTPYRTNTPIPSRTPSRTPSKTPTRDINPPTGGTLGTDDGSGLMALLAFGSVIGLTSIVLRRKRYQ